MICFDTAILIWGVQGAARATQTDRIERTRRFIRYLERKKEQVMVPTPALAEYLQHFDDEARSEQLARLQRRFVLPAFDLLAAHLAAQMARKMMRKPRDGGVPRQALKVDVQIVATAVVHGAKTIYTGDRSAFERIAADTPVRIAEVPSIEEQRELPLDS